MPILNDLNPAQRRAVEAVNGPVMIIAGAGSGKTRVLTYRVAHLIQCGVPPGAILALTFTNKAANEMKERIIRLIGTKAESVWMGTFHSMFARILRRECEQLGYTRSFSIYDDDDSLGVIKTVMGELGISQQLLSPSLVRSRISGAKNQMVSPAMYAGGALDQTDENIAKIYERYQRRIERSNAMDFDDLLLKPIELFRRFPNRLERYRDRFRFVLVDEFQDTNRAQYAVTKLLAGERGNVCVVGDDAQSIYAFRGADIRNILDFEKDFPGCEIFRLEQNYRSTQRILSVADRLIRYNVDQFRKELWTENSEGDMVTQILCSDDRDEGRRIVQAIEHQIRVNKYDLGDVAVLYRTNAQSRSLEDEFRRASIPYIIVGGIRFYERKEIKDVLAYLRLLVNPQDDESLRRVVNTPVRGVGETTQKSVRDAAMKSGTSLFDTLAHLDQLKGISDRGRKGLEQFREIVKKFGHLRDKMSVSELCRSLVDELGILRIYKEEGTAESLARWENVQELLSAITEFSDERGAGLEEFLEDVALVSDIDTWEGSKNAVTLMTLHSSKGLEFPVVFISGLEEGLLPFYTTVIDRTELEEERRLFYVGITRAQKKLFLTRAQLRYRFGEPSLQSMSRFVSELGEEGIEALEGTPRGFHGERRHGGRVREGHPAASSRSSAAARASEEQAFPDYESESQEPLDLHRGALVQHELFGRGRVLQVTGKGDAAKASVEFDEYGVKHLVLKFARLRPG